MLESIINFLIGFFTVGRNGFSITLHHVPCFLKKLKRVIKLNVLFNFLLKSGLEFFVTHYEEQRKFIGIPCLHVSAALEEKAGTRIQELLRDTKKYFLLVNCR